MKGYYENRNYDLSSNQDQISNLEQNHSSHKYKIVEEQNCVGRLIYASRRVGQFTILLTIFFAPTHPLPEPFLVTGGTI